MTTGLPVQPEPGLLAAGKAADSIAAPINPFADITVMEKVSLVMKAGTVSTPG